CFLPRKIHAMTREGFVVQQWHEQKNKRNCASNVFLYPQRDRKPRGQFCGLIPSGIARTPDLHCAAALAVSSDAGTGDFAEPAAHFFLI
ncbi:MAG: hypothetical protein K9J76_08965, partial [Polaromonas sp.]|nr:hypothetical protein [Polaromonas sp.]